MSGADDWTRYRLLRDVMFSFKPMPALILTNLEARTPEQALAELREVDPVGYALLTEHLPGPGSEGE